MTTDAQGRLWAVSDEHGLWCCDPRLPQGHRTQIVGDSAAEIHLPAVAVDAQNRVWVGSEANGVWLYDPSASGDSQWRQFQTGEGLGDNSIYALAVDRLGRVWAGHLNHGVSVFNGQKWQNYNVVQNLPREGVSDPDPYLAMAGPLGTRVFCIATSPADGDVWIGTEAGLTRYSLKNDAWSYFTRADGLPADGISALVFAADGTLYVGTECDGVAIASPQDNFATWRTVKGPNQMPITPGGEGLASNFINALAVDSSGTLFVGTSLGLAWSSDQGKTFAYVRGKDYADKVKGLYGGPPQGWKAPPKEVLDSLLAEDYVTSLAQAACGERGRAGDGRLDNARHGPLFIGYRVRAPQAFNRVAYKPIADLDNPAHDAVKHPMLASSEKAASLDEKEMNQTAEDLVRADKRLLTPPTTVPAAPPTSASNVESQIFRMVLVEEAHGRRRPLSMTTLPRRLVLRPAQVIFISLTKRGVLFE